MLDKIEVGKVYLDADGENILILAVGERRVFVRSKTSEYAQHLEFALDNWKEIPTQKKRYWLWDVVDDSGKIFKSATYTDEKGNASNGDIYFEKEKLIKKHENEWIEV